MIKARTICRLALLAASAILISTPTFGQEAEKTPSDKTKEALQKLNNAPAAVGQTLQGWHDAAKDKLRQSLGAKNNGEQKAESKPEGIDLNVPQRAATPSAAAPVFKEGGRDPFRPLTMRAKVNTRSRENLSPLERLDLSQIKVVGIVWDIKEPRAMVEDTAGLGYVIKVGTPIGSNDGVVKAIYRNQVVVEEMTTDNYGTQKKRDVSMTLATE
jgi:Tfp pilus assembly protein PilP